ncbi:MAG TPA: helix-turn-helix transcriptional regulator [Afipia sp.]
MAEHYPDLGKNQPKTLWTTTYRNFGSPEGMKEPVDPLEFGRRVRELREEFGWSQTKLGKAAGFSQSNIGWIESGSGKDPKKQALALADALGSSPEWLLHGTGARQTGIRPLTKEQITAVYEDLPLAVQMVITNAIKAGSTGKSKKKAS